MPKCRQQRLKSAFGLLAKSPTQLKTELKSVFAHARLLASRTNNGSIGSKNQKRLRSRFAHALAMDVIYQPVGISRETEKDHSRKEWQANPIWDLAPKGAFYKSKRTCSLLNDIAAYGHKAHILHDMERLSMYVWTMSKRSFDGLCRRIRSKIYKVVRPKPALSAGETSRPEATEGLGTLTVNPPYGRVELHNRCRSMGLRSRSAKAIWLSTDVDVVRIAHRKLFLKTVRS